MPELRSSFPLTVLTHSQCSQACATGLRAGRQAGDRERRASALPRALAAAPAAPLAPQHDGLEPTRPVCCRHQRGGMDQRRAGVCPSCVHPPAPPWALPCPPHIRSSGRRSLTSAAALPLRSERRRRRRHLRRCRRRRSPPTAADSPPASCLQPLVGRLHYPAPPALKAAVEPAGGWLTPWRWFSGGVPWLLHQEYARGLGTVRGCALALQQCCTPCGLPPAEECLVPAMFGSPGSCLRAGTSPQSKRCSRP